ncbi:DnaJ-domain-containing protein, partial [Pyrenochaeta sp. DS3sAY3a]
MARKYRPKKEKKGSPEDEAFINDVEDDVDAEDGPPTIDPYAVLELEKEASAEDVKKAYRKLALKHHPDKAAEEDKEAAHKSFQEVAFAYAVLSDERRRARYDRTGSTAETLEDDDEFDWLKFYRAQFEDIVNEDAINNIANEYKGSDEEREDIINAYDEGKGSLGYIYSQVMLSDILVDDDRFRKIIDEEIANGTVKSYQLYYLETDETRQNAKDAEQKRRDAFDKREAEKEAKEVASKPDSKPKAKSQKKSGGDMSDLAAMIQQRQKSRAGNFFDHLEAKYAPKSRGSKRATPMEEPPEEAFQATAALKKQKPSGRAKKAKVEDDDMDLDDEDIGDSEEEEEAPRKAKAKPKAKG